MTLLLIFQSAKDRFRINLISGPASGYFLPETKALAIFCQAPLVPDTAAGRDVGQAGGVLAEVLGEELVKLLVGARSHRYRHLHLVLLIVQASPRPHRPLVRELSPFPTALQRATFS